MGPAFYALAALLRSKSLIALLALFTHYILNIGEWDNKFHLVLITWATAFGGAVTIEYAADPEVNSVGAAVRISMMLAVTYFSVLLTSMLLHRGFFHRLRKIPGPFLARFTKFHSIFAGVLPTNFQFFKWQVELRERYGTDVIRTGPREVTVYCADAVPLIHGPTSRCKRATIYNVLGDLFGRSIQLTTDKNEHRHRRKIWDRAFNAKALREYEPRLNRHAFALISKLKEMADQPSIRITDWLNFYSFDVMGDIGFNRSFGMVKNGKEDNMIKLLHDSQAAVSIFEHISWAMNLAGRIPAAAKPLTEHVHWSRKVLEQRAKNTPKENDIFSWLLTPGDERVTMDMNADSRLLIIAGSDTTAATLSYLIYELCLNPAIQTTLHTAIATINPETPYLSVSDLTDCEYLDGVIHETLRLHPAVPSGAARETPPEGLTLPNGTYIPGAVSVWIPMYSLQRDARYWVDPLTFMPERWSAANTSAIKDKRAFLPFLTGAYNCVGQKLAIMEMRSVVANFVRQFEVGFAEGEDGGCIERESRDCFTMTVGKLDVKLTPRHES
ncbi:cytochrome p450 [Stemphylium lycopersici]|nr:cytochrome p450 [Stemphylium lycopersici]